MGGWGRDFAVNISILTIVSVRRNTHIHQCPEMLLRQTSWNVVDIRMPCDSNK